ncbi:MAG TPA: undecaprenyldiphospho-muramoylpentapeptide beta-N-acetylglucosaminyltransferase [Steroidobacteraceae bacterium]|nr:undecaprenyldiphospho-muramoylpentapeptide beta-N-acetylglucosaminyltransferase [Steroidobacteraceae bacterium]
MSAKRPALIMAGGTGGHVFPALALARLLRQRSIEVVWLGTRRGLEARIVPAEPIPIEWLSVGGLRGKGVLTLLAAPWRLARAMVQALRVMWRRRPFVVVGLGGFVTGPGGVAAWLTRRPLIIHEQNAIAGFTNRCLAHLAGEVFEAFPGSFGASVATRVIGNPVRWEIAHARPPAARFAERGAPIRVLVIGGSQGAVRLNRVVPHALAKVSGPMAIEVRHQSGEGWLEAARRAYADAGVRAEVTAFIEDMASAYEWADLVICRAGALTISELAAAGVGAILVPFPAAVDDHQTANARYLVAAGAAVLIDDRELTAERLRAELARLCSSRGPLLVMAERARALARPRAAEELADACFKYVEDTA